jgi:hypothetical protein
VLRDRPAFVIGLLLLRGIDEARGMRAAGRA